MAPAELFLLLGLPLPGEVRARSETFKELETSTDLVVERVPPDDDTPVRIVEFQGYRDKQFLPKLMVRCGLFRVQHPHQSLRCHVIYLDRIFESVAVDDGGVFCPQVSYLPDLIEQLQQADPNSPLLSVLRPLTAATETELTSTAAGDYDNLRATQELTESQRATWLNVFHFWLMKRLKKTLEEIQTMIITQLPEVEELPWGQQLKARWTAEGRLEGRREGRTEERIESLEHHIEYLRAQDVRYDELHAGGELTDTGYERLKTAVANQLLELEAELRRVTELRS